MIYVASLAMPVKKAYPDDTMQSSTNRIIQLLNQAPEVSGMGVVILGPKDAAGPRASKINNALAKAHPDICTLYFYTKPGEADLFDIENKFKCKKITAEAIKDAADEYIRNHVIRTGKAVVSSKDFQAPSEGGIDDLLGDDDFTLPSEIDLGGLGEGLGETGDNSFVAPEEPIVTTEPEKQAPPVIIPDLTGVMEQEPTLPKTPLTVNSAAQVSARAESNISAPATTVEEQISGVASMEDWDLFMNNLKRESVVKRLIQENSEYNGLTKMIETLDREIESVWIDTALTPDQKFEKIKDIGLKRSACMAAGNSVMADKVIDIISRVTMAAKRTVEAQMEDYNAAISTIVANKNAIVDNSHIATTIQQRADIQFDLLKTSRKVLDLYKGIDTLVTEEIQELDRKLPSSNEFINEFVKPVGTKIFTPKNTAELANRLMKALQQNKVTASGLESQVNALIEVMFDLFDKDQELLEYYKRQVALLQANKIEDVIIADTVLKQCLRLWTGAEGTGRSATAITWAGILSRRNNSLLIDLTGKAKFETYGIQHVHLDDFMKKRIEKRFLCVQAEEIPTPERLQEIVDELKTRLNYYPYVNVIVSPDDINGLNQLSTDALTTHFICDCSSNSMETLRRLISGHTQGNVARRLIMINPPISPLSILDSLGADPTLFSIMVLPNIPEIRACALRHDRPYELGSVVKIFEEAFR